MSRESCHLSESRVTSSSGVSPAQRSRGPGGRRCPSSLSKPQHVRQPGLLTTSVQQPYGCQSNRPRVKEVGPPPTVQPGPISTRARGPGPPRVGIQPPVMAEQGWPPAHPGLTRWSGNSPEQAGVGGAPSRGWKRRETQERRGADQRPRNENPGTGQEGRSRPEGVGGGGRSQGDRHSVTELRATHRGDI